MVNIDNKNNRNVINKMNINLNGILKILQSYLLRRFNSRMKILSYFVFLRHTLSMRSYTNLESGLETA